MSDEKVVRKVLSRRINLPKPAVIMAIAGAGLFIAGAAMLLSRITSTHGKALLPNPQMDISGSSKPSEKKPAQERIAEYTVPADQPRSISVDTITGLVERVGVTKNNAMAAPSNVFYAGWYTGSAKPGQAGLSIINGHVSGMYTDGVFKRLSEVKKDDVVTIEFGDKSIKKFIVVESKKLPESEAASFLFTKRKDVASQLNLITCAGTYNRSTHSYADRIIVVAKLANAM